MVSTDASLDRPLDCSNKPLHIAYIGTMPIRLQREQSVTDTLMSTLRRVSPNVVSSRTADQAYA